MNERRHQLRQAQRDAIWKWRWLGFRAGTSLADGLRQTWAWTTGRA